MFENVAQKYISSSNAFYRRFYDFFLAIIILFIIGLLGLGGLVFYQFTHKPLPVFSATQATGERMLLVPFTMPNQLPDTIIRFASKAAVAAYTYSFASYTTQQELARPYFTEAGWEDYLSSLADVIQDVTQNQLIINSVVTGAPVIINQGTFSGKGYAWRVQMPFLVIYQSSSAKSSRTYYVTITIVQVPTKDNPQGIGVDQFVMR